MMATVALLDQRMPGNEIVLIEKNPILGRKVMISGGGRCNVTTGRSDITEILNCYPRGNKFLNTAMRNFPPDKVQAWFETQGVPLKTEKDLRVFPQSNRGKDVVGAFEKIFIASQVKVLTNQEVTTLQKTENGFEVHLSNANPLQVKKIILTTGGEAYRHTGSTGEGYRFAEKLGHSITPLSPSLNALILQEDWPKQLSGVAVPHVKLTAKGKKKYTFTGPILFTHKGITGPGVFGLSAWIASENYTAESPLLIEMDLLPTLSSETIKNELTHALLTHPLKTFHNTLSRWLPKSLIEKTCETLRIQGNKNNAEISKNELHRWTENIKKFPVHAVGRAAGEEFVTAGGISLKEVNPQTMESKLCLGLYFAGEILDIDGFTGGFNLQAAWATGRLAGEAATARG